jgi:hypothetical protein
MSELNDHLPAKHERRQSLFLTKPAAHAARFPTARRLTARS